MKPNDEFRRSSTVVARWQAALVCFGLCFAMAQAVDLCCDYADSPSFVVDVQRCNHSVNGVRRVVSFYNMGNHWRGLGLDIQYQQIFVQGPGGVLSCSAYGQRSTECETEVLNNATSLSFDGDSNFCGTHSCQSPANCYCQFGSINEVKVITDAEGDQAVDPTVTSLNCTFIEEIPQLYTLQRIQTIASNNETIFHELLGDILKITFTKSVVHSIIVNKQDYVSMETSNELTYVLELPLIATSTSGPLYVTIYANNDKISEWTEYIIGKKLCTLSDCIVCWSIFSDFDCLHTVQKVAIISVLILVMGAIIVLLPWILGSLKVVLLDWLFSGLRAIISFLWNAGSAPWIHKAKTSVYGVGKTVKEGLTPKMKKEKDVEKDVKSESEEESTTVDINYVDPEKYGFLKKASENSFLSSTSRRSGLQTVIKIATIISLIQCVMACDTGLFITATGETCTARDSTSENCKIEYSATVTVPNPGAVSCLRVMDSLGSEVATIEMKFLEAYEVITPTLGYYTSNWTGVSQSTHRCWSSGQCQNTYCEDMLSSNVNAGGELTDPQTITYTGLTTCTRSCGCAACSCFYCVDGCIFSRAAIVPSGNDIAVYTEGAHKRVFALSYTVINNGVVTSQQFSFDTSKIVTINNFTFNFVGSLAGDSLILGGKKLIVNEFGVAKLGVAAEPNFPLTGYLGDIQANTALGINTPGTSNIKLAPALWTSTKQDKSLKYAFKQPGAYTWGSATALPSVYNGALWMYSASGLKGVLSNPGALLLQVSSPQNYSYVRQKHVVCPQVSLIGVSGCYSCSRGASAVVDVISKCMPGTADVHSDDNDVVFTTPFVTLNATVQRMTIHFTTPKVDNSFTMCITGSEGDEDCVSIVFRAFQDTLVDTNNTETINSTKSNGSSDTSWWGDVSDFFTKTIPNFFDDIFNGIASWWEYLIFAGLIILLLLIIFLLFWPAISKAKTAWSEAKAQYHAYKKVSIE